MLNLVISLVVGIVLFLIACFAALQIAPDRNGSLAAALRIGTSCLVAVIAATLLYVYLEG